MSPPDPTITLFPLAMVSNDKLFTKLHTLLNNAYDPPPSQKDSWPLPRPYYRLRPDPEQAWIQFNQELGEHAMLALAFIPDQSAPPGSGKGDKDSMIPDANEEIVASAAIMPFSKMPTKVKHQGKPVPTPIEPIEPVEYEFSFVTTASSYRGRGLSTKLVEKLEEQALTLAPTESVRIVVRTLDEISGEFWRKLGYREVEDMCVVLKEGFSYLEGFNGLTRDTLLWGGDKWRGKID